MNYLKSLKLNIYSGENIADCCATVMVSTESLESDGSFKPDHIGYITRMFEDTSDYRFLLWEIYNYKQVKYLIKKL